MYHKENALPNSMLLNDEIVAFTISTAICAKSKLQFPQNEFPLFSNGATSRNGKVGW